MSEDGTTPGYAGAGNPVAGNPATDRMQALLSRAVEEQLSEQRTVANALAEVRAQVAAVGEGLRGAASGMAVERLRTDLSGVATELRMSTTGLGERFDVLARRLDDQSAAIAAAGSGTTGLTSEVTAQIDAVAADVAAQAAGVQRLGAAIGALAAFPQALAALQKDVAGMNERLTPLADVLTAVADLQTRGSAADAVRPQLETLAARVEALASRGEPLATSADVSQLRDSVVASLTERIDGLANRPALSPGELTEALLPLQSGLALLATGGPELERINALDGRLQGLEGLLGQLADRLAHVGDAAGGIPAVATDLRRVIEQVEGLDGLSGELAAVRQQVGGVSALTTEVTGLRQDVEDLGSRVAGLTVPGTEEISAAVADRLVEQLAPRIADVVLERIGRRVAQQVGEAVSARVLEAVETNTAESEARLRAHMDEAVISLAEALLRKRRPNRSWAPEAVAGEDDDEDEQGDSEPPPPASKPTGPASKSPRSGSKPPVPAATTRRSTPLSAPSPAVVGDQRPTDAAGAKQEHAPPARAEAPPAPPRRATPARPTPPLPRGEEQPANADSRSASNALDVDHDDDDDAEDGSRRRPWWRPGG